MERKPRLSIKYWEKLFKAKAETAFDGIHGYIVILNGNTDRYKSVTLDYLSKLIIDGLNLVIDQKLRLDSNEQNKIKTSYRGGVSKTS